jgi:hypothetical protein
VAADVVVAITAACEPALGPERAAEAARGIAGRSAGEQQRRGERRVRPSRSGGRLRGAPGADRTVTEIGGIGRGHGRLSMQEKTPG